MSHLSPLIDTERAKVGRPKDSIKREEILDAATQLFIEHGFEQTSLDRVARQAGVSKLTIYSHFTDKNELFCAIMQNRCLRFGMPQSFMDLADLSAEDALIQIATNAAAKIFHPDSLSFQRILYAEAVRYPEIIRMYYDAGPFRVKNAFADLLREFDAQGKLAIPDSTRATEQFFSLLKGERLLRCIMRVNPPPDAETLAGNVKATVNLFLKAYSPTTITGMDPS